LVKVIVICRRKAPMEVIRGRERDCRQEVRSAVERGGTRPIRRVDPQRQAFRPAPDEGRILLKADVSELGEGWSDSRRRDLAKQPGSALQHVAVDSATSRRRRVCPARSSGRCMEAASCGIVGADARPNWQEQPERETLTGIQWRCAHKAVLRPTSAGRCACWPARRSVPPKQSCWRMA
jgi:hypothetical protein